MWKLIDSLSGLASLVLSLSAVIIAGSAWVISSQMRKHQLLNSYFRKYRSPQMGTAVQELWDIYRRTCHENQQELIQYYIDAFKRNKPVHIETRRMVSAFYQEIAILVQDDQRLKDIVYSIWKRGDLAIIKDILLPIETIAIQIAKGDRIEPKTTKGHNLKRNRLPAVMQAMYDLYRYAPE